MSDPKFIDAEEAAKRLKTLGSEFALVKNPAYVTPPFELYPLAPKPATPKEKLVGVVKDMDGTTTTTENLCLHSQEVMVRRITGRLDQETWAGLDHEKDYPHIIGNSTTRHVEYLIQTYRNDIRHEPFVRATLEAALWTLIEGRDERRRGEVAANLSALGWNQVLEKDVDWQRLRGGKKFLPAKESVVLDSLTKKYATSLKLDTFDAIVRMAIDVYYYRYHEILTAISAGQGGALSKELLGGRRLIEPMPGVAVFLALIRGWLGDKAGALYETLLKEMKGTTKNLPPREEGIRRLTALGKRFAAAPLRIAVVTSSIRYEADIVLNEVFGVLREQIAAWPICPELAARFTSPVEFYDAFITASDSSEIRLKPHRDLYSIALYTLGIRPADFDKVVGFEDSESGTIAIRAAGVGLSVAVPFADTAGHNLEAAAFILPGGLPQAILEHNLFLALT